MSVALKAEDACEWCYRGEGAVNLVLSYSGNSPNFIGKVLRIQKTQNNGFQGENDSTLSLYECLLWKETEELISAPTREIAKHMYVKHVMCRLLGSEHVDPGMHIHVSREFLEAVDKNVLFQRPSWRVSAAMVNLLCDSAILMSDHSVFPHGLPKEEFCVSVEIKPKCGFLPESKYIEERNSIKRSVTRFKMHQALKLHEGKIPEISEYNPLDLFSGSKDGILKAFKALYRTPQNNFRIFLNGSLIFGDLGGGAKSTNSISQDFEGALKYIIEAEDGMHTEHFLELVTEAFSRSGLLDRLLCVQKLDSIDIEGAIHAYYDIVSQPCILCNSIDENKFSNRYTNLHSQSLQESLKIVRDYLIAATAKDLSMMISFRPRDQLDVVSSYDVVVLKSTNQAFDYKVSFIDLDMKELTKMEHYYKLDQEIVQFYSQMVKTEPCVKNELHNAQNLCSSVNDESRTTDAAGIRD